MMIVPPMSHRSAPSSPMAASMAASLAGKPSSGGRPAIDAPATAAVAAATGIERRSPRSSPIDRVPVRTSISPTTMNRAALNTAWASSRPMAAKVALGSPRLRRAIIKPSCEMVPQARTSLASRWRRAPIAPHSSEASPKAKPRGRHGAVPDRTGPPTATSSTPALTMVAECR